MRTDTAMQTDAELARLTEAEGRRRRGFIAAVTLLTLLSAVSVLVSLTLGPLHIPASEVMGILLAKLGLGSGAADPVNATVVLSLRFPRILLSWLVGAALAVSGCAFQGILRNPLADPFTIGVSTGAAFGATLAIFFGLAGTFAFSLWDLKIGFLPLAALLGALTALFLVIMLGRAGGVLRRETLVLAGIVVATFLSALISLLKSLDEESVTSIVFWIMGSFQGRGMSHLSLFLPYFLLGTALVWLWSRELDILSLGEAQARQLGLDAEKTRTRLLIGASILSGTSVAVSGVIGFVGLIVPHIARMVVGAEHRPLLVVSGLAGGICLLWSDVLARTLAPGGAEMPVGVVTALLGGPFFCLLLKRKAGGYRL